MSQTIITNTTATLSPDAELTLDGAEILAAINVALDEAASLGGHDQEIVSIEISTERESVDGYGGPLGTLRAASIQLRTRLT